MALLSVKVCLALQLSPDSSGAPYEVAVDFFLGRKSDALFWEELLYASRKNKDANKSVAYSRNSSLLFVATGRYYKQKRPSFPIVSFLLYEIVNQNPFITMENHKAILYFENTFWVNPAEAASQKGLSTFNYLIEDKHKARQCNYFTGNRKVMIFFKIK